VSKPAPSIAEELTGAEDWSAVAKSSEAASPVASAVASEAAKGAALDFSPSLASEWDTPFGAELESAPELVTAPVTNDLATDVAAKLMPSIADDHSIEFESAPEFSMPEVPAEFEPEAELAAPAAEFDSSALSSLDLEPELPESTADLQTDFDELELPPELEQHEAMPVLDLSGIDLELASESIELADLHDVAEPVAMPAVEALLEPVADQIEEFVAQDVAEPEAENEIEAAADFDAFAESAAADFEPVAESMPEIAAGLATEPETEEAVAEAAAEIDPELHEEVNTKLDLARAYLEMGDREGAHEILQEVLGEGDSQQKTEAEKLLAESA
jgi:pilus assembly protein FimV